MTQDGEPPACMCDNLRRTTRAITRLYDEALRSVDLRITQFSLLAHLHRRGEVRVRDLAESLLLEETTLSRNLRPLVDRELVTLRAGDDRREKYVSLSASGRALLAKATPLWSEVQARVKERVSSSLWESTSRALPKLAAAAS